MIKKRSRPPPPTSPPAKKSKAGSASGSPNPTQNISSIASGSGHDSFEAQSRVIANLVGELQSCDSASLLRSVATPLFDALVKVRVSRGLAHQYLATPTRGEQKAENEFSGGGDSVDDGAAAPCSRGSEGPALSSEERRALAENQWISDTWRAVVVVLEDIVFDGDSSKQLAVSAFDYLLRTIATEWSVRVEKRRVTVGALKSASCLAGVRFPLQRLARCLEVLMSLESEPNFLGCLSHFVTKYVAAYSDCRYYALPALEKCFSSRATSNTESQQISEEAELGSEVVCVSEDSEDQTIATTYSFGERAFTFLQQLPNPDALKESDLTALLCTGLINRKLQDHKEYKVLYCSCWMTLLRLDSSILRFPSAMHPTLLSHISTHLLPYLTSALFLAKFYINAFNDAPDLAVSVQALSGLFYLLVNSKLAEPQLLSCESQTYYGRLFSLLQPPVLNLSARVRFLRLLRASLQSKLLSTETRAAFIKKLVTVALLSSVSAACWLLSVAYGIAQSGGEGLAPMMYGTGKAAEAPAPVDTDKLLELAAALIQVKGGGKVAVESAFNTGSVEGPHRTVLWDELPTQGSGERSRKEWLGRMALWEIETAKRHWHPSVSQVARLFDTGMFAKNAAKVEPDNFVTLGFPEMFAVELKSAMKAYSKGRSKISLAFAKSNDNSYKFIPPALSTADKLLDIGLTIQHQVST